MRKYEISYENLVYNTMLDVCQREKRRTIDEKDISSYLTVLSEISHDNNIDLNIKYGEGTAFKEKMEKYFYIKEDSDLGVTYTLYPWLDLEEFTKTLENTIFVSMQPVLNVTKQKLNNVHTHFEKFKLRSITMDVDNYYMSTIREKIISLDNMKLFEEKKLQKIRSNYRFRNNHD